MPHFEYIALDSQGVEIKNEIEALSEKEAISKIRNMGYFPTKVRSKSGAKTPGTRARAAKPKARRGGKAKVKEKLVTEFARQLSTLQDAGLPILRSLRILEDQAKKGKPLKRIIGYVADDIEGGSTLSEAFAKYPRCFDRLMVNMVAAGEAGGVLDLILARVADFKEKAIKLRSRVKSAMVYPMVVLGAAFTILLALMKFVIPQFKSVLTEMVGDNLNPVTQTVLNISGWIAYQWGWAIMLGIPFVIVFIFKFIAKFRPGRVVLDSIKLRLPIIGELASKISITRWTRTLGTLIGAGVPILDGITVTGETAGNEVYSNLLTKIHNSIRQGDTFAGPLRQSKVVDGLVANMVSVGEETGDLDKMLLKVADNYDEQVEVLVGSLMSLLEPVMILVLGGIVMTIVLAVFLPMIQVIGALSSGA